ncbi:class I SAM-dependent methyltransferase [Shimazuella kribbensis]|uniref:class I SAM-dependent methyltransferase n=1 Tax=Shimazuella kribbensis TaxID=139808 RepID=UPI000426D150|nr:class I SAM-dependent methyltransferase [Shimazuella kribbensis]
METSTENFYDEMADDYHLIYSDWKKAVLRQGEVLSEFILSKFGNKNPEQLSLLDCSCGIGTQAIGLAKKGFKVTATDLSLKSVSRAKREAALFQVNIDFGRADFRSLAKSIAGKFDVVLSADNAIPHLLTDEDLLSASQNLKDKLQGNGLLVLTIRDYDSIVKSKPVSTQPRIFEDGRVITFQVWDWSEKRNIYAINHFIMKEVDGQWLTKHTKTTYRALLRQELCDILNKIGLFDVKWHMPEETGFYQPIVTARK